LQKKKGSKEKLPEMITSAFFSARYTMPFRTTKKAARFTPFPGLPPHDS
jgi:hypothetical protein